MRSEPRKGPSAVPMPPMMLLSAKRTERSIENTCEGSTKPTYCAQRLPPIEVSAALSTTACTRQRRVAMPSASAASSSSRTPASADGEPHADGEPEPRVEVPRAHERGRVGADAEERCVPERDLARVAARDVPARGERAPQQDENHAVEHERVARDERRRRRGGEERDGRPAVGGEPGHAPRVSAPRCPKSPAGRKMSTPMKSRK